MKFNSNAIHDGAVHVKCAGNTGYVTLKLVALLGLVGVLLAAWFRPWTSAATQPELNSQASGTSAEAVANPRRDPANIPMGFVVYTPFNSAEAYQADPHFNPTGKWLPLTRLTELQRYLDDANFELAKRQDELRVQTEAWGTVLIENGVRDSPDTNLPIQVIPQTTRVGLVKEGISATVTVKPGDNAHLDELSQAVHTYVRDCHDWIRNAFQ